MSFYLDIPSIRLITTVTLLKQGRVIGFVSLLSNLFLEMKYCLDLKKRIIGRKFYNEVYGWAKTNKQML